MNEALFESRSEIYLTIAKPVFEGNAQWRFTDGNRSFSASIEDSVFRKRVDDGIETFARGDRLLVEMLAVQRKESGKLKTDYKILRVIEHLRTSNEVTESFLD